MQGVHAKSWLEPNINTIDSYGHLFKASLSEVGPKLDNLIVTTSALESSPTIEQFGEGLVKERLTIVANQKASSQYGTQESSTHIEDPEIFHKLYEEIQREMFIRANLKK